ncbi:heparinase II/III family protein [Rhodobacteraceae bacterium NNCM2]|nr:heparinase II/III family protein [Coraliihabitans acroporae]
MGVIGTATGLRASFEARRACWGAKAGALLWQPPPPVHGDPAAARRLIKGILLFDGAMRELAPDASPWAIDAPGQRWSDALHGHGWIDDLACIPGDESRRIMARWVHDWIETYGRGTGPGWTPVLAARRLVSWVTHSTLLLNGASLDTSYAFFRALNAHARYLDRLWRHAPPGIERIEAVAGMLFGRVSLEGGLAPGPGITELGRCAEQMVDADGAIASRNPQDLMRLAEILGWSAEIIATADLEPDPRHVNALRRLRPALAALIHADGRLARFHGGRGSRAPAVGRAVGKPAGGHFAHHGAMGFVRMEAGQVSALMDAAPPPRGAGTTPHASALALEFTAGAHPVIVSAGSGIGFGAEAAADGASTPAHSTVNLRGESHPLSGDGGKALRVSASVSEEEAGHWALGESHAWRPGFGLIHERRLHLDRAGTRLAGEDTLVASDAADRARLVRAMPADLGPHPFCAHFLVHPEAKVRPALNGRAALIELPSGARWMLRTDARSLTLAPARYFETNRIRPRATKLIVVTGEILEYWGRITWSLEELN